MLEDFTSEEDLDFQAFYPAQDKVERGPEKFEGHKMKDIRGLLLLQQALDNPVIITSINHDAWGGVLNYDTN